STTVRFTDVTPASGIRYHHAYVNPTPNSETEEFGGGVAAGDYDGDGLVDLFVLRGDVGNNLLYRNLGDNVFRDMSHEAGVAYTKTNGENYRHSGPAFADMDGDGDLDLFVGGIEHDPSFLFENNGDGTFTDVTPGSGVDTIASKHTLSAGFGDYDLDGDLDMFLTHWGTPREAGASVNTEHLWRNDTTDAGIRFTDVSLVSGIAEEIIERDPVGSSHGGDFDYTFTPTFDLISDDLFPDLVFAYDFLTSRYFVNNGDGTFVNETDPNVIVDRNGMGSAVGDYDGDGDLDWFVSSIWAVPDTLGRQTFELGNRLYNNHGGQFADVTEVAGVHDGGWGWGSCFADFDNDGNLDIYHTNGWLEPFEPSNFHVDESRFFHAHGDGTFREAALEAGLLDTEIGHGIVCADFDNDGDVDIFLAHLNEVNSATFWRNDTPPRNYLRVKLNGLPPNTEAAGARIRATVDGTEQLREIHIGSNFTSQNPTVQIFGLDDATQVDTLEVEWPDGRRTSTADVQQGQTVEIDHPDL
ncbi:MAG: CRTAC1 family protein, partial [Gammaproteobacteria bacterium]|nr:CRTAC1 family protein [Gammaproteobacteria bacterium]